MSYLTFNGKMLQSNHHYVIQKPFVAPGLDLIWDNIVNVPVASASSVSDWNTFFDLPTNGVPFISVSVSGNTVTLFGGSGITIADSLFLGNANIISVIDNAGCIIEAGYMSLYSCVYLTTLNLPALITAGDTCFSSCTRLTTLNLPILTTAGDSCFESLLDLTTLNLPALITAGDRCFFADMLLTTLALPVCNSLGTTHLSNNVFYNINGNTIHLTIPSALMTCNAGNPDGDITYLQSHNTVTVTQV